MPKQLKYRKDGLERHTRSISMQECYWALLDSWGNNRSGVVERLVIDEEDRRRRRKARRR